MSVQQRGEYEVRVYDAVSKVDPAQWNAVVERSPLGSVFQRHGWLSAIEGAGVEGVRHVVVTKSGAPLGVLPAVVDALPGSFRRLGTPRPGYGGLLVLSDEEQVTEALLDGVERACEDTDAVGHQFTALDPGTTRYERALAERGYRSTVSGCRPVVDLRQGWEAVLDGMSRSRRRAVRTGLDRSFEVTERAPTREALDEFYAGYRRVIDRVGGTAQPRSFFRGLTAVADRVFLPFLTVDGDHAGALLCLLDEEQSTVHYLFSAVEREHFDVNASELLHAHAMRRGIENGFDDYDFGETRADFRDGLFGFKAGFGGRVVPTLTWERGCDPVRWPAFRVGRALYRRFSDGSEG
ncbi:lipid II:glycine glycyltransferase FemX [Halomarina ordinaria]|uniref:Lipid II:glycine glycyltransferase FemX n=1 Tax=Halomarina ordinaria TaxID=3033939 RepID=A0ABD5UAV2_9EURY|nr:GNAT family N-acetyltransferase [Halomarina sp. PSRA2]